MGWRDLLQPEDERIVLPWVGGRSLRTFERGFAAEGELPAEHGWHAFRSWGSRARWIGEAPPRPELLRDIVNGYLVGDRLVPDQVRIGADLALLAARTEPVHLVEPGVTRFARLSAGRVGSGAPLIYQGLAFPLGPEDEVAAAFFDGADGVDHIRAVPPALDAAFRIERWREKRAEERRRAAELERRRRHLREQLGDGAGRREMAAIDFAVAARAALAVGGADLVDFRTSYERGEMVVQFRLNGRRFECTCESRTLRIIDSGVCLVDHESGERGDARFTLESLPGVIRQAEREGRLVIFRYME